MTDGVIETNQPVDGTATMVASASAGQRHLEQLLAVRNQLAKTASALAISLRAIRGPGTDAEQSAMELGELQRETHTSFFSAADQLVGDLRSIADRITSAATELAERF